MVGWDGLGWGGIAAALSWWYVIRQCRALLPLPTLRILDTPLISHLSSHLVSPFLHTSFLHISLHSLGHQLHFDTEERTLSATGEVLHPAVTAVTYLSAGGRDRSESPSASPLPTTASSPTIIYDQQIADCTDGASGARIAHVAHPVEGTTLFYPGERLHCVCPAAPPQRPAWQRPKRARVMPSAPSESQMQAGETVAREREEPWIAPCSDVIREEAAAPRVTLMVSFWTRPLGPKDGPKRARHSASTGVCAAVPPATRSCSWPRTLDIPQLPSGVAYDRAEGKRQALSPQRLAVPEVSTPWERLPSSSSADAWRGLVVPEERDMHFFVRSMAELHGCYGNE